MWRKECLKLGEETKKMIDDTTHMGNDDDHETKSKPSCCSSSITPKAAKHESSREGEAIGNVFSFKWAAFSVKFPTTTKQTRLKILPVLTREHYTSLLHWV
jgi:hypothetical protein